MEILRSYARSNDLRRDIEMNLENARREIEYLKSSRWAGSSERSPIAFTLGTDTVKELGKHGMDLRNWDYDRLIEKWRSFVRDNRNFVSGMAAQKPLPDTSITRSCSMASMPNQPFTAANAMKLDQTPYSAPATINGTDASSDQVDAEGEDDDADVDIEVVPASNNANTNTPLATQLGNIPRLLPLQPTPVHPNNIQTHDHLQSQVHAAQVQAQAHAHAHAQAQAQAQQQAHAQAQAQAQAQAWAAARQHMNQSRNQQHHQLSPHPSHMGSATNSRRTSTVMMDAHAMSAGGMLPMDALPMDGIENSQNQFLRMDMGMGVTAGFVGSNDTGV